MSLINNQIDVPKEGAVRVIDNYIFSVNQR